MKIRFLIFVISLVFTNLQTYAQTICGYAKTNSTAAKSEKIIYKKYASDKGREKELRLGFVRPVDNLQIKKRPLIIGVHGGGFVNFCPFEPCYELYSERILTPNFTPRGFLTASVQYRLTAPFDFNAPKVKDEVLKEAHYKATQDVREAIKFVFENADKLGVDRENVFLIGTSAGAITVLHAAFLDDDEAPKDLVKKYGKLAKRENIGGVISLSGAIYDLSYLDDGDKVPLMLVHGSDDGIVPFGKGFYFGMKHLTPVFGGKAVFDEARKKGIDAKGFFYDFGHSIPGKFKSDIFRNANDFISSNLNCSS